MDKFWDILAAVRIRYVSWSSALLGERGLELTRKHRTVDDIKEAFSSDDLTEPILAAAKTRDPDNVILRRQREANILGAMQRDYTRRHFMTRRTAFATSAYSHAMTEDLERIHIAECVPKVIVKADKDVLSSADENVGVSSDGS